jgi:rRNA processing protein Krr1/Pno1
MENIPIVERQIAWDDLAETVAIVRPLVENMHQCAILVEGRQVAHMFLLEDGVLALTEIEVPGDVEPSDNLVRAIGRIMIEHRRVTREGRSLL